MNQANGSRYDINRKRIQWTVEVKFYIKAAAPTQVQPPKTDGTSSSDAATEDNKREAAAKMYIRANTSIKRLA